MLKDVHTKIKARKCKKPFEKRMMLYNLTARKELDEAIF